MPELIVGWTAAARRLHDRQPHEVRFSHLTSVERERVVAVFKSSVLRGRGELYSLLHRHAHFTPYRGGIPESAVKSAEARFPVLPATNPRRTSMSPTPPSPSQSHLSHTAAGWLQLQRAIRDFPFVRSRLEPGTPTARRSSVGG